eukprot:TRINITY_DN14925_c0_g1_i1.p1 TRINITY_DN14925_c0_g1~~TRINITY_DN14925_c0_g1_i1.p1  ORF type:complete len:1086 (-),score=258.09 TRINITY_DN14925_c0_g1_i1:259-3516(-)
MAVSIIEAAGVVGSAAFEAVSLVWMELALFAIAGIIYLLFSGSHGTKPGKWMGKDVTTSPGKAAVKAASDAKKDRECARVYADWKAQKLSADALALDLANVTEAMRKLGMTPADIAAELQSALDANESFLANVEALPAALLRDGAVELLGAVIELLEKHDRAPDSSIYVGLMAALLRRRDYAGVAAAASRVSAENITPKMRALLAAAAAHGGNFAQALEHLGQIPAPSEGQRSALSPAAAAQVLSLAVKESRVSAATEELIRVGARLESNHVEDLLQSDSRRRGNSSGGNTDPASRLELLDAIVALQVPKSSGMYQAVALTLGHKADSPGVRALLTELEASAGTDAPIVVNEALALALLEACKSVKGGDIVNRTLELHRKACAGAPSAKVLSAACAALAAGDRTSQACDFYEKEMMPKGIWPSAALTAVLLKAAAQCGRASLAQKLADHAGTMRGSSGAGGSNADLQRQATMIKAHARERDLNAARAVFERLQASGKELSPLIYKCFLDALVHCGDHEGTLQHFEEMKRLNFVDVVGFNTMLKAHLGRGNTQAARALVQDMAERGLQPNKVTYNELLHSKVMAKDHKGIWGIIDEMHASGVKANSVTCSILLKSLTDRSESEDVRRIVDLIDEVEEPIDEVLFSSVIEACIRIRQLDLLSDLMRRYRRKGGFVSLAAPTYGSMIKAYGQAGDVNRVRELWAEMQECGVKPTAITLGCMTEALVMNHQAEEALQLLHKELECEERKGCINTVIYSTVLKGFAFSKRIDKVFSVYKEMRSNGVPCNTITYNTMLDACAKCSAMSKASSLLQDMKETGVAPDIITYSTIIKGYCLEGDVDRAFSVLEEMRKDDKFEPDEIMYNSILDGCAKRHRVEAAMKLLDEMKSAGVCPSNYTLSILVKLLGHARRLGQAFRLVDDLSKQHGFRPNVQVYTCLVQACILNRKLDQALELHDTMVADASCRVDDKFYAVLAKGCLQMHQPLKAVQVVRAAFGLPGSGLAERARRGRPVGVESGALAEVAAKLQAGSSEDQAALQALREELQQQCGVEISAAASRGGGRGGGGGGAGGAGARRGGGGGMDRRRGGGK